VKPVLLLLAGLFVAFGVPDSLSVPSGWWHVSAPVSQVTAVFYVGDSTVVPTGVRVGMSRLSKEKDILAFLISKDVVDGNGEVPEQCRVPLEAAKKNGLPTLVVMGGETVLRVVKAPVTELEVWSAVP